MVSLPKFDNPYYNTLPRTVTVKSPGSKPFAAPSVAKAPAAPQKPPAPVSRSVGVKSTGLGGFGTGYGSAVNPAGKPAASPTPATTGLAGAADRVTEKTTSFTGYTKPVESGATKIKLPSYKKRDDSVASHMDKITARDSEYMMRAEAEGREGAQARGMLNSSLGIGAARGAALDKAFDIASQDASQNFQFNLADHQGRMEAAMRMRDIVSREAVARNEIQSREAIAYAQELGALERLGAELSQDEKLLKMRIDADYGLEGLRQEGDVRLQSMGDASAMERLSAELASREGIAAMDNRTTRRGQDIQRYGIDTQARTTERGQDIDLYGIDTRSDDQRYATDRSFESQVLDNETRRDIAKLDTASRERIADADREVNRILREQELDQNSRNAVSDGFNNAVRSYALQMQAIDTNTSLRADDRQTRADAAFSQLQDYIATTEAIHGVSLQPEAARSRTTGEKFGEAVVIGDTGLQGDSRRLNALFNTSGYETAGRDA